MTAHESLETYQKRVLFEIQNEAFEAHGRMTTLKLVSFVSHSQGRGKNRRRGRDVTLLVDHNAPKSVAYQVVRGEIRPQRKGRGIPPDILAMEVLSHLPQDEQTPDRLLELISQRTRKMGR